MNWKLVKMIDIGNYKDAEHLHPSLAEHKGRCHPDFGWMTGGFSSDVLKVNPSPGFAGPPPLIAKGRICLLYRVVASLTPKPGGM